MEVIREELFYTPNLTKIRDRYRDAATSKMERFVIVVNGWKLLDSCCSSPRSASEDNVFKVISVMKVYLVKFFSF